LIELGFSTLRVSERAAVAASSRIRTG